MFSELVATCYLNFVLKLEPRNFVDAVTQPQAQLYGLEDEITSALSFMVSTYASLLSKAQVSSSPRRSNRETKQKWPHKRISNRWTRGESHETITKLVARLEVWLAKLGIGKTNNFQTKVKWNNRSETTTRGKLNVYSQKSSLHCVDVKNSSELCRQYSGFSWGLRQWGWCARKWWFRGSLLLVQRPLCGRGCTY